MVKGKYNLREKAIIASGPVVGVGGATCVIKCGIDYALGTASFVQTAQSCLGDATQNCAYNVIANLYTTGAALITSLAPAFPITDDISVPLVAIPTLAGGIISWAIAKRKKNKRLTGRLG